MAQFDIGGAVYDINQPTQLAPFPIDLNYSLDIGSGGLGTAATGVSFHRSGSVQADGNGPVSVTLDFPDDEIDQLSQPILYRLAWYAFVPLRNVPNLRIEELIQDVSGAEAFSRITRLGTKLQIGVDFTGLRRRLISITTDLAPSLSETDTLALELMAATSTGEAGQVVAAAPARRAAVGDFFLANLVFAEDAIQGSQFWLRVRNGKPTLPATIAVLSENNFGRVIARTARRADIGDLGVGLGAPGIVLADFSQAVGVGTVSSSIPEQINEDMFSIRGLDVDFELDRIRLRGDLGIAVGGFQLLPIGSFDLRYAVRWKTRDDLPFEEIELSDLFALPGVSADYDILPGFDINEVVRLRELDIEQWAGQTARDEARDVLQSRLAARIQDEVNTRFAEFTENLNINPALIDEIRSSFFICGQEVEITVDEIAVTGLAGVWHWAVGLQAFENCPANFIAAMYPRLPLLSIFRNYERTLSATPLVGWMKAYRGHGEELVSLIRKDPSLAGRVARLAMDLEPVLSGTLPLSEDSVRRISDVLETIAKQASPELRNVIDSGLKVFEQGTGRTLKEIVTIAGRMAP